MSSGKSGLCTSCQNPSWNVLTSPSFVHTGEGLTVSISKATKTMISSALCKEGVCVPMLRIQDTPDNFQIYTHTEKFTTETGKNKVRLRRLGTSSNIYSFEMKGKQNVLKCLPDIKANTVKNLTSYLKKGLTEEEEDIGYFLLEGIFSIVMGECGVSPQCEFVGVVKIGRQFHWGIQLEKFDMDLRTYIRFYGEELDKVTGAIWNLCEKLAGCGVVWWDIKPPNIVLNQKGEGVYKENSARFIDMDCKYLVHIKGKETKTLARLNFLFFVISCQHKSYERYRKGELGAFLKKTAGREQKLDISATLDELVALNKDILKSMADGKYPESHVEPWITCALYGLGLQDDHAVQLLGVQTNAAEREKKLSKVHDNAWKAFFVVCGMLDAYMKDVQSSEMKQQIEKLKAEMTKVQ